MSYALILAGLSLYAAWRWRRARMRAVVRGGVWCAGDDRAAQVAALLLAAAWRARRARVRCVHAGGAWLWVDETEGEE